MIVIEIIEKFNIKYLIKVLISNKLINLDAKKITKR